MCIWGSKEICALVVGQVRSKFAKYVPTLASLVDSVSRAWKKKKALVSSGEKNAPMRDEEI